MNIQFNKYTYLFDNGFQQRQLNLKKWHQVCPGCVAGSDLPFKVVVDSMLRYKIGYNINTYSK
jgi:hypothetical protein